jgi:hypothetical protein
MVSPGGRHSCIWVTCGGCSDAAAIGSGDAVGAAAAVEANPAVSAIATNAPAMVTASFLKVLNCVPDCSCACPHGGVTPRLPDWSRHARDHHRWKVVIPKEIGIAKLRR